MVGSSGMGYGNGGGGNFGGDSKYQSYDSTSYGKSSKKADAYGLNNPFGDYSYNKSTLDKYKSGESKNKTV